MWQLIQALREAERFDLDNYFNQIREISYQNIRAYYRVPEVLPCTFDRTIDFWLERLSFWGNINITHIVSGERKRRITKAQLVKIFANDTMLNTFGKWSVKKLSFKSVELYRNYVAPDGKKRSERVVVDIDLCDEIKQAMKGKV